MNSHGPIAARTHLGVIAAPDMYGQNAIAMAKPYKPRNVSLFRMDIADDRADVADQDLM